MVKLLELRSAEFSTKTHLVFAEGVGNHISQMSSDVFATFRGRLTYSVKAADLDVGRAGQSSGIEVRRQIQTVLRHNKSVVEVAEDLPEVIHACKHLVRPARRDRRVPDNGVV